MPADPGRPFYDTNVLLYLLSTDVAKSRKVDRFFLAGGTISVQVLNEFVNVARRKHHLDMSAIRPVLSVFGAAFQIAPLTMEIHDTGLRLIESHGFSTWDAMIIAAALESQCDVLVSEDMQNGRVVDGRLAIVNPFLDA